MADRHEEERLPGLVSPAVIDEDIVQCERGQCVCLKECVCVCSTYMVRTIALQDSLTGLCLVLHVCVCLKECDDCNEFSLWRH